MTPEYQKVIEHEKTQKITVCIDRDFGNKFWAQESMKGKIFNMLTFGFIAAVIVSFIKFNWIIGCIVLGLLLLYTRFVQKLGCRVTRFWLLQDEELFEYLYQARKIKIRNNDTKEMISFPKNWRDRFNT